MSGQPNQHRPGGPGSPGAPGGPGSNPPPRPLFGGGMMMMAPVQKARDARGAFRRLFTYLRVHKAAQAVVLGTAILSTLFTIVGPKVLGKATTKLFEGLMLKLRGVPGGAVDFEYIGQILLMMAGLYLISSLFMYAQQYIMASVAQQTVFALRRDAMAKLDRLPLKFFDGRTHGEILSRVTNDIDTISTTLQQSISQTIMSVVTVIGVLIMMLTISPLMTLIAVVTLPVSFLAVSGIVKRSQKQFKAQQKLLGELNGHVEEMLTGHKIVKAFGHEQKSIAKFTGLNEQLYEVGWKAQFLSGMMFPLMGLVSNLGFVLVAVVGGIQVTRGAIAIGDVQAFIQYSRQFSMPIAQIANISNVIQSTLAAAERVFELLDEPEEVTEAEPSVRLTQPKGAVRFEHATFGYGEAAALFRDLNIDVVPGQTIAIVGPTGAGKTTLVNLLMRFYDVTAGRVSIDGVDIRQMKRGDLRRLFGMVLQDTWLFNGTIRENIAYGRAGASEADVVRAARAAYADHFIRRLPDGYNTVLNEEASNLSQGQKQLLTIARAILADPPVLILDEATSSVDTRTEIHIQRAMQELMAGRTSFVIAHRLSTIREADLILVMDHGAVIEQGTHAELLAMGGFYADLYNSQFRQNGAPGPPQPARSSREGPAFRQVGGFGAASAVSPQNF